jgi:hypothetical protein
LHVQRPLLSGGRGHVVLPRRWPQAPITVAPGRAFGDIINLAWTCLNLSMLGTKRTGRPSTGDPCTPRAERPTRQPRTLSVTVMGCSTGIWARALRVDRGVDGFRGPSGAHFVMRSLLVLGPKYQIFPSRRFCVTETPENRNAWMSNS